MVPYLADPVDKVLRLSASQSWRSRPVRENVEGMKEGQNDMLYMTGGKNAVATLCARMNEMAVWPLLLYG